MKNNLDFSKAKKIDLISCHIDDTNRFLNLKFRINDEYCIICINDIDLYSLVIKNEIEFNSELNISKKINFNYKDYNINYN